MLESFENKKVPFICDFSVLTKNTDQEDMCSLNTCTNADIDCGECLFSSLFCNRALFEQWKNQKLKSNYE